MSGYVFSLFVVISFCNFSNAKVSHFYRMEPAMNDKVSNTNLVGEYHSESLGVCSAMCGGRFGCFGFNARQKKCRIHKHYPASMTGQEDGWVYYISIISESAGCGSEWLEHNGHYYFYGTTPLTWNEAQIACEAVSSQLVQIEDKEESDWLAATFLFKSTCSDGFYSDCTAWSSGNISIEGNYRWQQSNLAMNFTYWNSDQPSGSYLDKDEDCVEILRNGKWNDRECGDRNWLICEKTKC